MQQCSMQIIFKLKNIVDNLADNAISVGGTEIRNNNIVKYSLEFLK